MMRRKKTVLILLSIFPGLPLLLIAAALAIRGCDEPPPADEDLKVQRLQIPADQNAFTYFQQAAKKLKLPKPDAPLARQAQDDKNEADEPQNERQLYDEIVRGERWDGPLVERVLKDNAEALALWEKGLAAPHYQAPEVKTFDDRVPHLFDDLHIANLVLLRARAAAKRGDHEAAFGDDMKLVRFGYLKQAGKGCLVEYLVGITVKGMGVIAVRDGLAQSAVARARLRDLAAQVSKCPAETGLADALRNDYEMISDAILRVANGKITPTSAEGSWLPSIRDMDPRVDLLRRFNRSAVFNPQETRRICADIIRARIANVPKPFKDMTPDDMTPCELPLWRAALPGNPLGRRLCRDVLSGGYGVLEQKCRANVELAATRILLAIKAHKLEKGKLPATLAELAPEYLDSVPLDDYDGQPMRYNAARKVVYSVGKNLTDDGGSGTRAEYVAGKRKEAEAAGEKWTDEDQKGTEAEFDEWSQPDVCFEIKF